MTRRGLCRLALRSHFNFGLATLAALEASPRLVADGGFGVRGQIRALVRRDMSRQGKRELGQLVMKLLQSRGAAGGAVGLDAFELGAEFVEEQGADEFKDVLFRGVVRADLPTFFAIHDGLEQ